MDTVQQDCCCGNTPAEFIGGDASVFLCTFVEVTCVSVSVPTDAFDSLTFLCQRGVGFVFVHQQLDLLGFERRVKNLVQARVSLFAVDELCHLLHGKVRTTLSPPENKREDRGEEGDEDQSW